MKVLTDEPKEEQNAALTEAGGTSGDERIADNALTFEERDLITFFRLMTPKARSLLLMNAQAFSSAYPDNNDKSK